MNIRFFMEESAEFSSPRCSTDVERVDGVDLLACLLIDNGGVPFNETIPWLDEGVNRLLAVRRDEKVFTEWARDAWAAHISKDGVKIYSLYDEDFSVTISLGDFEKALRGWKDFLVSL
ncbi:hypothetical protein PSH81_18470 [Pseudomonas sp. FP2335]|uniref:hypothetical protein n=1 Tax=Pseudomonas sp. FP2335 TaxID=2954092 RepID=UPI002733F88D|nr:hypothetical protein [Pseudomonas sp. FP2335]WLH77709.1 hypothetical protein PSH81_18470 [Pseudomonas sp. FP2335]